MNIQILYRWFAYLPAGLLYAVAAHAGTPGYDYVELLYCENNSDKKTLSNGSGFTLGGSVSINPEIYAFGWLNHSGVELGGKLVGQDIDDWLVLGAGYHRPLRNDVDLTAAINYQSVELSGKREHGGGILLGVKTEIADVLGLEVRIGYFELVITDWQLITDVTYRITDRLDLVGRIRDFADWDYTSYEGGIRYRF